MVDLAGTLSGGDHLKSLEALRDAIGADLEVCESMRDKAALYLRLTDVLRQIDAIKPAVKKGDAVDEIAQRRTSRRAGGA